MFALLLALVACSSGDACESCRNDAVCVEQHRTDGSTVAECVDAPASCADVYQGGSCADEFAASAACRADAAALCPTVLPDHSGFTCLTDGSYDYLSVVCENR